MLRRWCIPLAGLGLVLGSVAAAGTASAAPAQHTSTHVIGPAAHLIRPGPGTRPLVAHGGPANAASSTNWSGYAAASGTYTSVSASWTEPTGTCSGSAKYSSFWVGLDGYNSSTVEQTGSEVDCSGSTPEYYSWYEMYPAYPVNFSNTVRPGDHFTGSVTVSGSSYTLKLSDTTQGWSHTVTKSLVGRGQLLRRGDRGSAVLHGQRRHPAAGPLQPGHVHQRHGERLGDRELQPDGDRHGERFRPGQGLGHLAQRRQQLQGHLAAKQLTTRPERPRQR